MRNDCCADASFAARRDASRLGTAIAVMTPMMVMTIRSSIKEKPACGQPRMPAASLAVIRFCLAERRLILTWSATRPLSERYCIYGAKHERAAKRHWRDRLLARRYSDFRMLMSLCHGSGAAVYGKRAVGSDSRVRRIGQWKISQAGITLVHGQCFLN